MARVTLVPMLLTLVVATADAQPAGPKGRGGMMNDEGHMADMQMFHALLDRRADIRRQITTRSDGVETLTESDVPEVARLIQEHVASMYARVEQGRPIHLRDPLFREIFAHAKKIEMRTEHTPKGVRVIETSSDPYVASLIQAHADVVSAFIANGRAEMMKNHPVPPRPE